MTTTTKVIEGFRDLVRRRLGDLAVAVLDVRLEGGETKSLVGSVSLGSPGRWVIKKVVCHSQTVGHGSMPLPQRPELLQRIEKAMAGESETVGRRRAAMAARQGAA